MHGAFSQRGPAAAPSRSPSPSLSPSQQSSTSLSSHPPPLHVDPPSASVPPSLVEQSNDQESIAAEDSRFEDAMDIVRGLNEIVNNHWRGPWISYSSAPKEVKDLWWNEFKRKFSWDESQENEIRRIFNKKASDHIRNVMNKAKKKNVKPHYITGEEWTEIKRTWEGQKMNQRTEQNAKNRAFSSSEGSSVFATYAGGSINIGEHRKRLAHDLVTEATYAATFERVFQRKIRQGLATEQNLLRKNMRSF